MLLFSVCVFMERRFAEESSILKYSNVLSLRQKMSSRLCRFSLHLVLAVNRAHEISKLALMTSKRYTKREVISSAGFYFHVLSHDLLRHNSHSTKLVDMLYFWFNLSVYSIYS